MNLAERGAATEAVLAHFRDKPFSWSNCIRLARAQGVALGHELPPVPQFRSALGAKKALAKRGADSVEALLDSYFARHPAPAFALIGDLVALPGDGDAAGLQAVGICDGRGNVHAWDEDDGSGLVVIKHAMHLAAAAWRL